LRRLFSPKANDFKVRSFYFYEKIDSDFHDLAGRGHAGTGRFQGRYAEGFQYGGRVAPFGDKAYGKLQQEQMKPRDLLLGRKTFDIWEPYWPAHADAWPGINEMTKYVLSTTRKHSGWQNTIFLSSPGDIKKLKDSAGSDIRIWGSSELVQSLLKHDLVDELQLKIHPLLLGKGKKDLW
jgi:dihydrofolate reductase